MIKLEKIQKQIAFISINLDYNADFFLYKIAKNTYQHTHFFNKAKTNIILILNTILFEITV